MFSKLKNLYKNNKKNLISFALTNRQYISFVLLLLIECSLLVILTLGFKSWNLLTLFFDFAIIVLIGSFGYLFKPDNQYKYFQTVICIVTLLCIINGIYYTFFNDFVTVKLLNNLGQVNTVTDAVVDKLTPLHMIYIIFPIIFYLIHRNLKSHNYFNYVKKIEKSKKNFSSVLLVGIILLCVNILTLSPTDISRLLVKQWNREYIVKRYGLVTYHINDLIQTAKLSIFTTFGYDDAAKRFNEFYSNKDYNHKKNKYTDIYKGKNLVTVHMESMMSMFIDMKINGIELTPNLNKLTRESLYFSNFYPQIGVGTSSDTEFTLNTSLMPALSGTVFVNYYDRNYVTLEKIMKDRGYYTFSMHGNSSGMWNRKAMHASMGYNKFYSKEFFEVNNENTIGLGISDHDFFEQILPYLKDIEAKNKNYMGTIITLTNHTPWDGGDKYGDFPLNAVVERVNPETGKKETIDDPYLSKTKIGNYIRSVQYADKCLGEFINSLYENDIFNDTVVVFYGDHDAKLKPSEYNYLYNYDLETGKLRQPGDKDYVEYDYYTNELNRKTPLLVWTKDKKIKKNIKYYMGMIDVMPTLGNMFGFENKFALGHDIFDIKHDNTIVFPKGNFLTENVYYNNSKEEYKVLKDNLIIDEEYIKKHKEYTEKILEISNDIIVFDLIELEGKNITDEE